MNPEPQVLELNPQPVTPATATVAPPPEPAGTPAPPEFFHQGNGKIARLPKAIRDQVNTLLLDGHTCADIIQRLGDHGKDLNAGHLHEWKKRGYQDWLNRREWLEYVSSKSEFSTALLGAPDASALPEAGLHLAAAQMLDQLARFAVATASGDAQPEKFARLVNALSRLTREALSFQKFHAAQAQPPRLDSLNPKSPAGRARTALLDGADDLFGFRHCDRLTAEDLAEPAPMPNPLSIPVSAPPPHPPSVFPPPLHPMERGLGGEVQAASPALMSPPSPPAEERAGERRPSCPSQPDPHGEGECPETFHASEPSPLSTINPQPPVGRSASDEGGSTPTEHCLSCHGQLPRLYPDGHRPCPSCPNCGNRLPPPGTSIIPPLEHCPACDTGLPLLLPNGQRPSANCLRCYEPLPPPGAAVPQPAEHCLECGARLPAPLPNSERPNRYCECGASLPPPLPRDLWLSEYCPLCGIHLPQPLLSRYRTTSSCPACNSPLPPLPVTVAPRSA